MFLTPYQEAWLHAQWEAVRAMWPDAELLVHKGHPAIVACIRNNLGDSYTVGGVLPPDFPNSPFDVLVINPSPVIGHNGKVIRSTSASMHTLGTDVDGYLRLCHHNPSRWRPDIGIVQGLLKARLWVEALASHRTFGKPIDTFIPHQ